MKVTEKSYWTNEERFRLGQHIHVQLKKLLPEKALIVQIQPEVVFLKDNWLRDLKGSEQGGVSIWLRETFVGFPFSYQDYLESALHEAAHAITLSRLTTRESEALIRELRKAPERRRSEVLTQATKKQEPRVHRDKTFRKNHERLRRNAKRLGIWPAPPPPELAALFKDDPKRSRRLIEWLVKSGRWVPPESWAET